MRGGSASTAPSPTTPSGRSGSPTAASTVSECCRRPSAKSAPFGAASRPVSPPFLQPISPSSRASEPTPTPLQDDGRYIRARGVSETQDKEVGRGVPAKRRPPKPHIRPRSRTVVGRLPTYTQLAHDNLPPAEGRRDPHPAPAPAPAAASAAEAEFDPRVPSPSPPDLATDASSRRRAQSAPNAPSGFVATEQDKARLVTQ